MSTVTLDNCDREPIHIPGAIQPHGVLFACRGRELIVTQASANAADLFDCELKELLARPLGAFFDAASRAALDAVAMRPLLREVNPLPLVSAKGTELTAVLHRSGELLLVEIERCNGEVQTAFDPRLRGSVLRLQSARNHERLCVIAAEEVRALSGFDRVMVYRFDRDWNGEVVAEAKRDDLEPFLGLHYPASDIPPQARRLYTENWLRLIADVTYEPVPIVPELDLETKAPLDLSHATLRSVSPIHIQYLKNMGVTASMSVSLVIDGVLTGLLACHHYSGPHLVSFTLRETIEYLGQALSWHLRVLESADEASRTARAQRYEAQVLSALARSEELLDGLATEALVELTEAKGAAVVLEEGTRVVGMTPPRDALVEIVSFLKNARHEVFSTDHLAAHMLSAARWQERAAGLVAVAISRELGEYLLWFRPSTEMTVNWAGDPRKSTAPGPQGDADRLTPRGSFALWRETVRGRSLPWTELQVAAAARMRSTLLGGVRKRAAELRTLNERLRETDRSKDTFIATVSHELRTPLNAIRGWTTLLTGGGLPRERASHAMEVISRNTDALSNLVEDLLDVSRIASGKLTLDVEEVDLSVLVDSVCDALLLSAEAKEIRLVRTIESKEARVLGDATRLRQIVTNLVTNAVKFTPKGGRVDVTLRRLSSDVELTVADNGQGIEATFLPHVFDSFRQADGAKSRRVQGLGLGLAIVRKLVELHGGTVTAESEGLTQGSTFRVRLPLLSVRRAGATEANPADSGRMHRSSAPPFTSLEGLRVLVVEDEQDSRDLLCHVLEQCRAIVVSVPEASSALTRLDEQRFDVIVSDIGLPEMDGLQLMRRVRARPAQGGGSTLAVALTAYSRASDRTAALRAGYQAHVAKPADPHELVAVIASLVGRLQTS